MESSLRVVPLVLAIVVFGILGTTAWQRLSLKRQYDIDEDSLRLTQWPSWCGEKMAARINATIKFKEELTGLDLHATRKVADAYRSSPWVRKVLRVRKAYPNNISISVDLRQPILAVRHGGRIHLVDRDAIHLPVQYGSWPVDEVQAPLLTGVAVGPPPTTGVWKDGDILDAIATLNAVRTCQGMENVKIVEVDLSNKNGVADPRQSEIVLVTDRQARILWGRSPRSNAFGEHSVDEKVSQLDWLLRQHPTPTRMDLVVRFLDGGVVPN